MRGGSDTIKFDAVLGVSRRDDGGYLIAPYRTALVADRSGERLSRYKPDGDPDWRPLISRADEASIAGIDMNEERLYLQVNRVAYWRKDWEGLVAAACGINKLDGVNRSYSKSLSILFRAVTTAELAQSRRGLATVAKSLSLLGSDQAASAVLARIQPSWQNEAINFDNLPLLGGCSITVRAFANSCRSDDVGGGRKSTCHDRS